MTAKPTLSLTAIIAVGAMSVKAEAEPTTATGRVTQVSIHDEYWPDFVSGSRAIVSVWVDGISGVPGSCNPTSGRVAVDDSHPAYKELVSLALAAYLSGKPVKVHYDTANCHYGSEGKNAFDLGVLQLVE